MELMQLKAPPDRVRLMADAIERDLETNVPDSERQDLLECLAWLRYRLARWNTRTPADPAA